MRYKLQKVRQLDNDGWEGLNEEATFYKNALTNPMSGTHLLQTNKGKAFINFSSQIGLIKMLGSTGGRAGTEALIQAFEAIRDDETNRVGASWQADSEGAIGYYKHLGLDKYKTDNIFANEYRIPKDKLNEAIEQLRNRDKKWVTINGRRVLI